MRRAAAVALALLLFSALSLFYNAHYETTNTEPALAAPPSTVGVEKQSDGTWRYLVNGKAEYFVGMGYNAIYRYLPRGERADRYDRDFQILARSGVTTITGWDADKGYEQDIFDSLTLNSAQAHGLGVIMPVFMSPEKDYRDPVYREQLRRVARAKVEAYKDHPALRMWGLGNEVLIALPPEQYRPFGRVFIEIADMIHELDPNHPVIYREAEDQFLDHVIRAFDRGGVSRPWLLYGMNIYTPRIDQILSGWPSGGLDKPLFVTEFGPNEFSDYSERTDTYLAMWRSIRSHPGYVLGGAPYVWMAPGPEPVDSFYGLMDAETASPVDDTFGMLTAEFKAIPRPSK